MPSKSLATIAVAALTALAGAAPAGAAGLPSPDLARLAHLHPHRSVSVIAQFDRGVSRATALATARAAGGTAVSALPIIDGVSLSTSAARAVALSHHPGVHAVTLNGSVAPQSTSEPVNAQRLATAYPESVRASGQWPLALTGAGVTVAVIDTGIDGNLPDFKNPDGSSRVVESAVESPDATTPRDLLGHGTHVAGIIAGNSYGRDPLDPNYGAYLGIAPAANLVSIKVGNDAGHATVLDVIRGLQFAVSHKADDNIRVVNLSLESTQAQSYRTDPLDAAVEAAWNAGIVVVAAAGNRGTAPDAVNYAPGNDPYVISVGAVDDHGTKAMVDDTPATWSSYGVTQDGIAKPEVSAPGAHIVSVLAPGSSFAATCPTCIVGGSYLRIGGTSMAAPVVTGTVALMLQARPGLTPDQVKTILVRSAHALSAGTAPEINAASAVNYTSGAPDVNAGLVPSTLIDPATGQIVPSASSWSASSWSAAPGPLSASWAASSWSWTCACSSAGTATVAPSASSWSASSWSSNPNL